MKSLRISGRRSRAGISLLLSACTLMAPFWSGCAAMHPVDGVPVDELNCRLDSVHRSGRTTIDLSLLRQIPPPEHLVDTDDVLGIHIEGILGKDDEVPPVYSPQGDREHLPPSLGYPIRVRSDGTITLPYIAPLMVRGMTIEAVEDAIRAAYTTGETPLLQKGRDRIFVSLQKARTYRVLVIRQESGNEQGNLGPRGVVNYEKDKRGTGRILHLPAYQNDVLHALAETGGMPGLDAHNVVYVIRSGRQMLHGEIHVPQHLPHPIPPGMVMPTAPSAPGMMQPPPGIHHPVPPQNQPGPGMNPAAPQFAPPMNDPRPMGPRLSNATAPNLRIQTPIVRGQSPETLNYRTVSGANRLWPTDYRSHSVPLNRSALIPVTPDYQTADGQVPHSAHAGSLNGPSSTVIPDSSVAPIPVTGQPFGHSQPIIFNGPQTPVSAVSGTDDRRPRPEPAENTHTGEEPAVMLPTPKPRQPATAVDTAPSPAEAKHKPATQPVAQPRIIPQPPAENPPGVLPPGRMSHQQFPAAQPPFPAPASPPYRNTPMPVAPQPQAHGMVQVAPQPGGPVPARYPIAAEMLPIEFDSATLNGPGVVKIPLKIFPGDPPPISQEDIILHDGDIVYVESRETDFFYTAGLLGGGQYVLPRDYDIDVVDAIAIAESRSNREPGTRAVGGVSALNQDVTVGASKVVLHRQFPSGRRMSIKIDLYDAMEDPNKRVLVHPGDRIYLRYTPMEAVFAFFERHLIEGAVIGAASSLTFGD